MAQAPQTTLTNNFIGGLKTEFTGLNFPENAATDTDNCVYTLIGEVLRREGIDFEANFTNVGIDPSSKALSSYVWNNAGGDGLTKVVVVQAGNLLIFFQLTNATLASPLSTTKLISQIDLTTFLVSGAGSPTTIECQYTSGNGYLFVFHPNLDPFYCTFSAGTIVGNKITVKIRDFLGIPEPALQGSNVSTRAFVLTPQHAYNLTNQGWGKVWGDTSSTSITIGSTATFDITATTQPILIGDQIVVLSNANPSNFQVGQVTSYSGTTITVNINQTGGSGTFTDWLVRPYPRYVDTFQQALKLNPSNSDIWFHFKDSTNTFNPATTNTSRSISSGPAPQGFYILDAFNQKPGTVSGFGNALTAIATVVRPKTGTWFQGRVWYAGTDASVLASGTAPNYNWTENIYFSQVITDSSQFGYCYQENDPTSDGLFDELPTDGGVVTIQGCGSVYKLFPIQNGLLVFAANGIWFITGSQGIGFSANDYTITRISSVQSISSTSFINVLGYPIFWNEEGIYSVQPSQQGGGLTVDNLCIGTILTYYANIPLQSKKYARGDYNPVDFIIQWTYRSTNEGSVTDRYQFDKILNLNTSNKAFYPYTVTGSPHIHDVKFIVGPGGSTSPGPIFKYLTSYFSSGAFHMTWSEERDFTHFVDWYTFNNIGVNYTSYFVTGYRIHGQGTRRWQPGYIYMYSLNNTAYKIQNIWDYASDTTSGRWSTNQVITNNVPHYASVFRRHRLRGQGLVNQIKVSSVTGQPFNIYGWTVWENQNTGV